MNGIIDQIDNYFRTLLEAFIRSNLSTMFDEVNEKVGTITGEVAKTPASWDSNIYNLIRNLSQNIILPIGGMIISFVLVYELVSMVMDKNNMNDVGAEFFFRYCIKACIAVMLLSRTFDITMAIFDVGNYVVRKSGALVGRSTTIDVSTAVNRMIDNTITNMSTGQMVVVALESFLLSFVMYILTLLIMAIIYVRIIEIYIYISISPIPFATMANREWGSIGTNYIRGLCALAFQGFFIIVCVAIYSIMIARLPAASDLNSALLSTSITTVALAFSLFKTEGISKAIFNAH